jgi:hypothetical protein
MVLVICLHHSYFSCSCSDLKKWCHGDRCHASSVPVLHRYVAHLVIPTRLPFMASSIVSVDDLVEVTSCSQRLMVAPTPGVMSASGATHSATGAGVVGTGPQLGDDIGSPLWDLVMCSTGTGVPESAVPGEATPALGSSGAAGLGVSYTVFIPKPSTHHMHDRGSIVIHIRPKVFTDNQMSRIKYDYYYINSVSKDYDDSQWNGTAEDSITPQER